MRQAFAACVAFAILMVVAVVRCGHEPSPPEPPPPPKSDAAIADAPIDAGTGGADAAPKPKHVAMPTPKPSAPHPGPAPKPAPVIVAPMIPVPVRGQCSPPPNPAGCPITEPNINHPCDTEGVHCVYGTSCCPPVYVCSNGAFEAWFSHCD